MNTLQKRSRSSGEIRLRYTSHMAWQRTSIIASVVALGILWMLSVAIILGFVGIAHDLTQQMVHGTIFTAIAIFVLVLAGLFIKFFGQGETDILEFTDDHITFKVLKGNSRELSKVSIPLKEMAFVEHLVPRSEEAPLMRSFLVLHDTSDHKIIVPIWTMTNNILPIVEFLQDRNIRILTKSEP